MDAEEPCGSESVLWESMDVGGVFLRIANSLKRNYMPGESRKGLRATHLCALTASYCSPAAYNDTAPESLSLRSFGIAKPCYSYLEGSAYAGFAVPEQGEMPAVFHSLPMGLA